jgi:hypothetical protein
MDSTTLRRYTLFLGGFLLLLITFFFLIYFTPFLKPIRTNISEGFYSSFGNKNQNFGGYVDRTNNTSISEFDNDCNIKVKSSNKFQLTYSKEINPVLNLNLTDNKDKNNPNLKILCLDPNGIIKQFKENIVKNSTTDPKLLTKLGVNINQLSDLDNFEFYKLYSQKYSSGCAKTDKLNSIKFITDKVKSTFETTFTYCAYDNNSSTKGVVEYYFFNKDKKRIFYIRGYDFNQLETQFLIF